MNQEKLAKLQAQVRIGGKVQSTIIYLLLNIILLNLFCSVSATIKCPVLKFEFCPVFDSVVSHFKECDGIQHLPGLSSWPQHSLYGGAHWPLHLGPLWLCSHLLWGVQPHTRWRYLLFLLWQRPCALLHTCTTLTFSHLLYLYFTTSDKKIPHAVSHFCPQAVTSSSFRIYSVQDLCHSCYLSSKITGWVKTKCVLIYSK